MDKTYRFLSDIEPTDEQLRGLMQAVTQDVKERAAKLAEKHKQLMQHQLRATWQEWELLHTKNENK